MEIVLRLCWGKISFPVEKDPIGFFYVEIDEDRYEADTPDFLIKQVREKYPNAKLVEEEEKKA